MININFRDARPIYEQVKDGLCQHIISGVLSAGDKLPSVRELASGLAINPNTIQRAYRELEAEGYICSVPGKGSFVCENHRALQARQAALKADFEKLLAELKAAGIGEEELIAMVKGVGSDD